MKLWGLTRGAPLPRPQRVTVALTVAVVEAVIVVGAFSEHAFVSVTMKAVEWPAAALLTVGLLALLAAVALGVAFVRRVGRRAPRAATVAAGVVAFLASTVGIWGVVGAWLRWA